MVFERKNWCGGKEKIIFVFLGLVLLVTGIVCFKHSKDILPIKTDKVLSIIFQIYPQGFPNFTVSNEDRVLEIVNAINESNLKKGNSQIDRASNNFYCFQIRTIEEDISVEVDENTISIKNENFETETSDLLILLERTYHDIMNGSID